MGAAAQEAIGFGYIMPLALKVETKSFRNLRCFSGICAALESNSLAGLLQVLRLARAVFLVAVKQLVLRMIAQFEKCQKCDITCSSRPE